MNKIGIAIAIAMFAAGVLLGSAQSVDAGHDKPCPQPTVTHVPTKTRTPTLTPTPVNREKCAQVVGQGPCVFHPHPYGDQIAR